MLLCVQVGTISLCSARSEDALGLAALDHHCPYLQLAASPYGLLVKDL